MERKNKKRQVVQLDFNNNLIQTFESINQAGKVLQINPRNICACCKGNIEKINGFKFQYKN